MRIYYKTLGGHVHCRIFTTGSKCGDLVFTVDEWPRVRDAYFTGAVDFITELSPDAGVLDSVEK